MMGHRIAYSASSKINRKDFGLSFNMMLDGKFVVSDEIQIHDRGRTRRAASGGGHKQLIRSASSSGS